MSGKPLGYSILQIRLHWIVAVLVILQLVFGEGISGGFDARVEDGASGYTLQAVAHIVAGLLIGLLMVWRLGQRLSRGVPDEGEGLQALAAKIGHWAFYAILIVAPLVGLAAWFGASEDIADLHTLVKPVLIVLIAVHVLAALWHQFILKDGALLRMKRPG
ncbi:cytochrome b [Paragemmobacter straminiformis]|uniref:Cytochrome b n=1 Tax=Paragemmobacter straminiformis TaxID=2045119 RepID=A0A842I2D3_9RHOB|nr:cytochrome b/b6 domain-containing protein [Gemmobacter straminiformis]MBC2834130.1 cytochrome b [Gemmobacter straminiformis]